VLRIGAALIGVACALVLAGAGGAASTPVITGQVHGTWGIEPNGDVLVVAMRASGLPAGATLTIRCATRCRLSEHLDVPRSGAVRSRVFGHRITLVRGTVLELRATRPGYVGWFARLT
jgi:hypothetical protein